MFGQDLVEDAIDRIANKIGSKKNLTEQPKETIPNVEAKKADIPLGKVGNTEYEIKSDGVYFEGKKLNNEEKRIVKDYIMGILQSGIQMFKH